MIQRGKKFPRLIAFDLDGTIWSPDMYMLWGGGAPFRAERADKQGLVKSLLDRKNQRVHLLGDIACLLHELVTRDDLGEVKLAWVSCTDEPEWAEECLRQFTTEPSTTSESPRSLLSLCPASLSHIYKNNKQQHFRNIQKEMSDHGIQISFSDMLFFDNEKHNISEVKRLGVHAFHCPNGITLEVMQEALKMFEE